ncbi:unnamed protein product [Gongylonema pulchrum]|uniref:Guanylate cyclase domain-containing protein n=1 Tax=Gongylonema pulchrum TaxID=637853 RepID=A0A183ELB9_9BILA|nr:unnamed protein product [Gongylonema pulchrum]
MSHRELLLHVEHVKYRMSGAARSPVGSFYVYEDRVEWLDSASEEKLVILFSDIRGRIFDEPSINRSLQLDLQGFDLENFLV